MFTSILFLNLILWKCIYHNNTILHHQCKLLIGELRCNQRCSYSCRWSGNIFHPSRYYSLASFRGWNKTNDRRSIFNVRPPINLILNCLTDFSFFVSLIVSLIHIWNYFRSSAREEQAKNVEGDSQNSIDPENDWKPCTVIIV